jgi:hypothetical protein
MDSNQQKATIESGSSHSFTVIISKRRIWTVAMTRVIFSSKNSNDDEKENRIQHHRRSWE